MLTPSVVSQAGPVLLETAIKHYLMKKKVTKDTKARGDFMYDEGLSFQTYPEALHHV
jgi:hypothetical protein